MSNRPEKASQIVSTLECRYLLVQPGAGPAAVEEFDAKQRAVDAQVCDPVTADGRDGQCCTASKTHLPSCRPVGKEAGKGTGGATAEAIPRRHDMDVAWLNGRINTDTSMHTG